MIQQNALKLNALILELIEFRRLETGNKILKIKHVPVTEQIRTIAESFGELAESRKLNYRLQIEDGVFWNTDVSCLSKIVNNLISNAFKYTPENGSITVELRIAFGYLIREKESRRLISRKYSTVIRFWIISKCRTRMGFLREMDWDWPFVTVW